MPPEVRQYTKGALWVMNHYYGFERTEGSLTHKGLQGIPASPGTYTGPARVIMSESDFSKLQAGDVLVCPITSPSWAMLFPSIGAIVTNAGGLLSHPAIIAREYRVPAVVATRNATSRLKDGQTVTVDGSTGTVEIHS
jgi:pyruvate,water dikinase